MKNALIIAGVIIAGVLLFGWNRFFGTDDPAEVPHWASTSIRCIPGHQNLAFHFHPKLQILVDGAPETVPANIGISLDCMAEVHTHDASGTLHIEGLDARDFHLRDFFAVWDRAIERDGYALTATADGNPIENPADLLLHDGQQIIMNYKIAGY